jgi:cell shape-determining protein MreC
MNKAKWSLYALMTLLIVVTVALVIVPLPKLITYKQGQGVSQSVYWRGFGEFGQLLDSTAEFVKLDDRTQHLHICHRLSTGVQCQPFKIVEIEGPIAVLSHP